jgi:transcriptional regulator with XRE-family HTH domain
MGRNHATACYRELGEELRKYRARAGLTGDDICRATGWHRSKVSRVEKGHVEISMVDAIHYLAACKVFATQAKDLLRLCAEAERQTNYWLSPHGEWLEDSLSSLIFHESTADRSTSYEPMVIPGLLQCQRYARIWSERTPGLSREAVEAGIRLREERQQILHRPLPGRFTFYIHERALRLRVGSDNVMHEQLLRLLFLAALPHVTVRVLPDSAGVLALFGNPFRLFEYREHNPLVYLDQFATGLFLEDQDFVADYRRLLPKISSIALSEAQSGELIADLANALERGSQRRDAGIYELEEEQL